MAIAAPIAIVRRLSHEKVVNVQVLAGALCLYLLIGLFFSFVYRAIGVVNDAPLFVQTTTKSSTDITYFSYVTLTTVGYGDFTAAQNGVKMLAVTEALFGQLYLVSAVALVVSQFGRGRAAPWRAQGASGPRRGRRRSDPRRRRPDPDTAGGSVSDDLHLMEGAPPFPPERLVTLANWQDPPFNRWGFQHIRDLIPTARIPRGDGPVWRLPRAERDVMGAVVHAGGRPVSFARFLENTYTDGLLVLHRGRVVTERYFTGMTPDTTHLLMSVSKSVTSAVCGALVERGLLRPGGPGDGARARAGRHVVRGLHRPAPAGHARGDAVRRGLREPRRGRPRVRADLPVASAHAIRRSPPTSRRTTRCCRTRGRTAARSTTARS